MRPAGFADRSDQWWARVCYALALLVELYRAATVEHSRLMRLDERSRVADLLDLATDGDCRWWAETTAAHGPDVSARDFDALLVD